MIIEDHPGRQHSLYVRGLAKRKKNDRAGGENDIAEAKKLDPKIAKFFKKVRRGAVTGSGCETAREGVC